MHSATRVIAKSSVGSSLRNRC